MKTKVRISLKKLNELKAKGIEKLTPYTHKNPLVRKIFWKRLDTITVVSGKKEDAKVLDFGCGSGILLAVLNKNFNDVTGLDIDTSWAKITMDTLNIQNVKLKQADGSKMNFNTKFDAVFAADVLEHFKDLGAVIDKIADFMNKDGVLMISGPTENIIYRIGRIFFGHKKPKDHYHSIDQIINIAKKRFKLEKTKRLPFGLPGFLALFKIVRMKIK